MAIRKIVKINSDGGEILQKKLSPVKINSPDLSAIIKDMVDTMHNAPGIGIAANQIGIDKRIIAIDIPVGQVSEKNLIVIINPIIISANGKFKYKEGCLSLPEFDEEIKRFSEIVVNGYNPEWQKIEINANGLLSVVIQHEIDHLDGILLIDKVSKLKKKLYMKQFI